jgi:hypothetical protein
VTDRPTADVTYALVAALTGTPEQLAALRADRSPGVREAWSRFAEKALGDAWRRSDPVRLRLALAAAALAYEVDDHDRSEDLMISWWPYRHVAGRLGDPVHLFDDAARFASPEVATVIRAFGRREDDLPAEQWGWRATGAERGLAFERTDDERAGPPEETATTDDVDPPA